MWGAQALCRHFSEKIGHSFFALVRQFSPVFCHIATPYSAVASMVHEECAHTHSCNAVLKRALVIVWVQLLVEIDLGPRTWFFTYRQCLKSSSLKSQTGHKHILAWHFVKAIVSQLCKVCAPAWVHCMCRGSCIKERCRIYKYIYLSIVWWVIMEGN